jgi:hypothetical protein
MSRVEFLRCVVATDRRTDDGTDTDDKKALLLAHGLTLARGSRAMSFFSGMVASFLPRDVRLWALDVIIFLLFSYMLLRVRSFLQQAAR